MKRRESEDRANCQRQRHQSSTDRQKTRQRREVGASRLRSTSLICCSDASDESMGRTAEPHALSSMDTSDPPVSVPLQPTPPTRATRRSAHASQTPRAPAPAGNPKQQASTPPTPPTPRARRPVPASQTPRASTAAKPRRSEAVQHDSTPKAQTAPSFAPSDRRSRQAGTPQSVPLAPAAKQAVPSFRHLDALPEPAKEHHARGPLKALPKSFTGPMTVCVPSINCGSTDPA
jgi:hypothetical protein